MRPKTVLIGLDGATFDVLDPLMASGVMPFLKDLVARGVRAQLRSVMPPLTPPAWCSLITGKRPGRHGVFDFFQREEADRPYLKLTTSNDIRADTVWSLASAAGRKVLALNYPVTFPAPAINGCVVPGGWMPWKQFRLGCYPAGLFDELKTLPSFDPREMAIDVALEEKAVEGCDPAEYLDWVALHRRREQRWCEVARFLMDREQPDLVTIVFDGVDKLQHLCWRFIDRECRSAAPEPWELDVQAACDSYFRQLDGIVAELVDLAGADATVILASDHGFGPAQKVFYLNGWLEQHGYLARKNGAHGERGDGVGFSQIAQHLQQLDWDRTRAYAATPSGQGITLVRPGNGAAPGPRAYQELRDRICDELRSARDPTTGEPIVAEVWTREEAFSGPYGDLAPDISIIPARGAVVSILPSDALVKERPAILGSHRWEGVFMAAGPALRSRADLGELSIVDVAPLLLYSLGLPIPGDLDGRLSADAFKDGELRERAPQFASMAAPAEQPEPVAEHLSLDPESEAIIVERLKALGYVE